MRGKLMKKASKAKKNHMLDEYNFSQGIRGKYASRFAEGSNLVILSPDVAEAFPDSETVNEALRMLIKIARQKPGTASQQ